MLDPFDSEFLSQELRETWKKVEELEKENKILQGEISTARDYIKWCDDTISGLIKERNELEAKNEELKIEIEALEDIAQEELDDQLKEWNREQYGDY